MIYCIGDSFTAGDELPDWEGQLDSVRKPYPTSQLAWPALLEKRTGQPVINWGRGGSGHTRIIKRAMDATFDGADIVVVAWSSPFRIELADSLGPFNIWYDRNMTQMASSDKRNVVVKWLASEHDEERTVPWYFSQWLRQIILLQSFFENRKQKYVMVLSHAVFPEEYLTKFKKLSDQIDTTYFIGWPNNAMTSWVDGTPKAPKGHPLEEGHTIIADKIYEHIRNFGWVS